MQNQLSLTALIVDSQAAIREYIKETLLKKGIFCLEVEDGVAALELLENSEIDFVVSDVRMKRLDGMQFLEIIRRNFKDIPVIATTDFNDDEVVINAFRAGAKNVIKKPERLNELENVLLPICELIKERKNRKFDPALIVSIEETMRISNDTSFIPEIVNHLQEQIKNTEFQSRFSDLEISLYELIANAIEHGNLAITNEEKEQALGMNLFSELLQKRREHPDYADRFVTVTLLYSTGKLVITIKDQGNGFDHNNLFNSERPDMLSNCGRGIMLTKVYCDELKYNEVGNQVTMILYAKN